MPDSAKDQVRLLISDVGGDDGSFIFSDTEVLTFLTMRNQDVFLAAALALRTMAGNEALVSKAITFLELKTNGPAVAEAFRNLANDYEQLAEDESDIEILEMDTTIWADRAMRGISNA